jgi:hypothetical protein
MLRIALASLLALATIPVAACDSVLGVSDCGGYQQQVLAAPVYAQQQVVQQYAVQPVVAPVVQQYAVPMQVQQVQREYSAPVVQRQLAVKSYAYSAPVAAVRVRQPIFGQVRQNRAARIVTKGQVRGLASIQAVGAY